MKWIKFETNFWDSETAHILESNLGDRGLITYLRLLSSVGKDIQTADDVQHAHDVGWTKSIRDWAFAAKTSARYMQKLIFLLHEMGKISAVAVLNLRQSSDQPLQLVDHSIGKTRPPVSSLTRVTIKFKNIHEFVEQRALSSRNRKPKSELPGYPDGTQRGRQDKIREKPPLPPTKAIGQFPKSATPYRTFEEKKAEAQRLVEIAKIPIHERGSFGLPTGPTTAPLGEGEGEK